MKRSKNTVTTVQGVISLAMAAGLVCAVTAPPYAIAEPEAPQTTETEVPAEEESPTEPQVPSTDDVQEDTIEDTPKTDETTPVAPDVQKDKDADKPAAKKNKEHKSDKPAVENKESKAEDKAQEDAHKQSEKRMSDKDIAAHISDAYGYSSAARDTLHELDELAKAFPKYVKAVDKAHKAVVKVEKKQKKLKVSGKKITKKIERAQEVVDAANEELANSKGTDLVSVMAGRASFDDIDSKAYLLKKTIADREGAIAKAQIAQVARVPKSKLLAKKRKKALKRERVAIREAGAKAAELEQRIAEVQKHDRLAQESAESASPYSPVATDALRVVKQAAAGHDAELTDTTDMLSKWYTSSNAASGADAHQEITRIALSYLGVKYVWGGETPTGGFDCSGLTMYCYAKIGRHLTHFAQTQYSEGRHIEKDALMPGDLVFFGTGMNNITHVGIYLGDGEFIHAPHPGDVVKVTKLSIMNNYVAACRPA